ACTNRAIEDRNFCHPQVMRPDPRLASKTAISRPDPADATRAELQSRRFSAARIGTAAFVLAVLVAGLGHGALSATAVLTLAGAGVVAFIALVVAHDRHEARRQRLLARLQLDKEAVARRARQWDALPLDDEPPLPAADDTSFAAIAADLDLFGKASLRQLLGRTATPLGAQRLLSWLRTATTGAPDDLAARQRAVEDLSSDAAHRAAILVEGLATGTLRQSSPAALARWLDQPPTVLASPLVGGRFLGLPGAAILLLIADGLGMRVAGWWVLLVSASWTLRWLLNRTIAPALAGADALSGEARRYRDLLRLWERRTSHAPWLTDRQRRLLDGVA